MFKDKLKELREKECLSQQELADKLFVSRSAVAKWENGNGIPSDVNLDAICKFFNVDEESLLDKSTLKDCDDLNTPMALAQVFEAVRIINTAKDKKLTLDASDYKALVSLFDNIVYGVLGLRDEENEGGKTMQTIDGLVNMVLEQRKAAKASKDWATCDKIRDDLKALGVLIKDTKDGTEWTLE